MSINGKLRSLTITLVRHGESVDNLKPIWAGHRDATLSHFGHSQAVRLGDSFKTHSFHRIFCSDLKRAHLTANQIFQQNLQKQSKSTQKIDRKAADDSQGNDREADGLMKVDTLLREQHFGIAEGGRYDTDEFPSANYYADRSFKFQDGESREDVKLRARKFITQVMVPEWISMMGGKDSGSEPDHFCIVSHGIFLSEFIGAMNDLVGFSAQSAHPDHFSNTGWTRISVSANIVGDQFESFVKLETLASNQISHLAGLQRQPGGIGSTPWDPTQSNLDSFFIKNDAPK